MSHQENSLIWECKECNCIVPENDSVAFHLIEGILYGWCQSCFQSSASRRQQDAPAKPAQDKKS